LRYSRSCCLTYPFSDVLKLVLRKNCMFKAKTAATAMGPTGKGAPGISAISMTILSPIMWSGSATLSVQLPIGFSIFQQARAAMSHFLTETEMAGWMPMKFDYTARMSARLSNALHAIWSMETIRFRVIRAIVRICAYQMWVAPCARPVIGNSLLRCACSRSGLRRLR
jgi:hypothetical protein